jgi:hypothetical protein
MARVINCTCGGDEFRATVLLPVGVHISNQEVTLEVECIYPEDLVDLEVHCLNCGAELGPNGLEGVRDAGDRPSAPESIVALTVARTSVMDALQGAFVMTPLDGY